MVAARQRNKESDMTEFNPLLVEGDFPLFDQIRHDMSCRR